MKRTFLLFLHLATAGMFMLTACGSKSAPTVVPTTLDLPLTETPQPTKTVIPTPTLGIGSTRISEKDGATLVYVPAGEFAMGSTDQDSLASNDEKPPHPVTLDAFWIDQTEVTNAMYAKCVNAGNCKPPINTDHFINTGYADHPVVSVDWSQASAYCAWTERRLPTEAEWEKAARGTDGRIYPWGNEAPNNALLNYNDAVKDTTAVGQYPNGKSPYGAYDMAGNVWEWVNDWYDPKYYEKSPNKNPKGPETGTERVLRGSGWQNETPTVRIFTRVDSDPAVRNESTGFRCARDAK
ncbi:MAG TPA: formylglycine-generating enzyme family protein [Anaerolineales bacterium]|nr:formylglycine-generating enzyme family protein [Anaerolineales bacterium]